MAELRVTLYEMCCLYGRSAPVIFAKHAQTGFSDSQFLQQCKSFKYQASRNCFFVFFAKLDNPQTGRTTIDPVHVIVIHCKFKFAQTRAHCFCILLLACLHEHRRHEIDMTLETLIRIHKPGDDSLVLENECDHFCRRHVFVASSNAAYFTATLASSSAKFVEFLLWEILTARRKSVRKESEEIECL